MCLVRRVTGGGQGSRSSLWDRALVGLCSNLVPSSRGRSWCIPNLVPLNRANAQGSPGTSLPLACLSWLLLGCSEGTSVPTPAAPHLPTRLSTGAIIFLQPSSVSILHSVSPETFTAAPQTPGHPLGNDRPFPCRLLQNWGGFSSGLRARTKDRLGLRGLTLKEGLDRLVNRTQAGSWLHL